MIKEIFEKISSTFDTIAGVGQVIAVVYDYPESNPVAFPCVVMDWSSGTKQEDSASRTKLLTVNVICRVLMRQKNSQLATQARIDISDAILTRFTAVDVFDDLGGVADFFDITSIDPVFINSQADQPLFGFDVVFTAKKIMSV